MAILPEWLRFRWLRRLERREIGWLSAGLATCLLLFVFISLAGEVMEGDTRALDVKVLRSLRSPTDPSRPVGPPWIEPALLDLTSLGGPVVLGLIIVSVCGFLTLQGRYRTTAVVLVTCGTGELVNVALKHVFLRPRPTVVPHLRDVMSTSFPSGHAMESAIVYLTLGAMLMRIAERRLTKIYCMAMAVLLTLLVGVSRVYLGVHYPTDVLGGWIFGFAWACLCWLVEQRFEYAAGVKAEQRKAQ